MVMGRRADRLKADDPFLPCLLAVCPGRLPALRWGGNGYYPTLPTKTRQARRPQACRRATCTHQVATTAHTHPYRRQLPGDRCAVLCCAVLRCAVMWLHPLLHRPSSNGAGLLAADPVSHVTQRLFLTRRTFLPISLCLAAWVSSLIDRAGKCESPLPADELIQQWQAVGEKACQSGPAVPQLPPSSWPCLMRP